MSDIMKIQGIVCIGDARYRTEIEVDLESFDKMSEFDARQHIQDLLVNTVATLPLAIIENIDSLSSRLSDRRIRRAIPSSSCGKCGRDLEVGRPCMILKSNGDFCMGVGQ